MGIRAEGMNWDENGVPITPRREASLLNLPVTQWVTGFFMGGLDIEDTLRTRLASFRACLAPPIDAQAESFFRDCVPTPSPCLPRLA